MIICHVYIYIYIYIYTHTIVLHYSVFMTSRRCPRYYNALPHITSSSPSYYYVSFLYVVV